MITIENVSKTFGTVKALNNLTINITSGTVFGLVGSNGSGKSTLLRILSGVYTADSGSITIDGENADDKQEGRQEDRRDDERTAVLGLRHDDEGGAFHDNGEEEGGRVLRDQEVQGAGDAEGGGCDGVWRGIDGHHHARGAGHR